MLVIKIASKVFLPIAYVYPLLQWLPSIQKDICFVKMGV